MTITINKPLLLPAEGRDGSPFVTEEGIMYLRFDQITILPNAERPGVQVVYSFGGKDVFYQDAESYQDGMTLQICGFEGKMQVQMG